MHIMRKKIIITITVVLVLLITTSIFVYIYFDRSNDSEIQNQDKKSNNDMFQNIKTRGEALYKKKYYQSLIATYQSILKAAPDSKDTKNKLSNTYFELGKIELERGDEVNAIKNLEKSIELNPDQLEARQLLENVQ